MQNATRGSNPYRGGLSTEGVRIALMFRFCSNNALYSSSLSFAMFTFIPFNETDITLNQI